MKTIQLSWKSFPVKVDKVRDYLKSSLSSNYDGLICDENNLTVCFLENYSQEDETIVSNYWNSITESSFNLTIQEVLLSKVNDAMVFGQNLIVEAAISNIAAGITQQGKTKLVSDYCEGLQRYLQTGSLYAAVNEIDLMISQGVPSELSPFITEVKLTEFKQKILDYLT